MTPPQESAGSLDLEVLATNVLEAEQLQYHWRRLFPWIQVCGRELTGWYVGGVHELKGPDGEWVFYQVTELTGVRDLTGWPRGIRRIVRRVKPSRRDAKKLTAFEKHTGWRYRIVATNIPAHQGLPGFPPPGRCGSSTPSTVITPRSRTG
ncbi:hypothetical protein [Streptomyces sp. NPDC086182]|uniref:hypothetical protein n=1 Tax=Streptomyces sp. NPDC086182 TaxID=3155058 RepID=UPI00341F0EE2